MAEGSIAIRVAARLKAEEELMRSLNVEGKIKIKPEGKPPYRTYTVKVFGRTYLKSDRDNGAPFLSNGPHIFSIRAPAKYPLTDAPIVTFASRPPAHINVYDGGQVCVGRWDPRETLASLTVRTIRVLFLDPATYNFKSVADSDCKTFCSGYAGAVPGDFILPCPAFGDK
jgi:ubiquitin-protein ligase